MPETREFDLASKDLDELQLELEKEEGRFLMLNRPAGEERKALELEKADNELKDILINRSENLQNGPGARTSIATSQAPGRHQIVDWIELGRN